MLRHPVSEDHIVGDIRTEQALTHEDQDGQRQETGTECTHISQQPNLRYGLDRGTKHACTCVQLIANLHCDFLKAFLGSFVEFGFKD